MQPELEVEAVSPLCTSQPGAAPAQFEVPCGGWEMSALSPCHVCLTSELAGWRRLGYRSLSLHPFPGTESDERSERCW